MFTRVCVLIACGALALVLGACQKEISPLGPSDAVQTSAVVGEATLKPVGIVPAPSGQVTVEVGDKSLTFWPFTSSDFTGTPQDPINLVFFGKCDPLALRAALLSLDGDRSALGLPPVAPFNSRWGDAVDGDVQTGYGDNAWTGGVIQLGCGDYQQVRFHLRLFKAGEWTVANAHFEVLIPGTATHQVLSWELAEQFVMGDLVRSGLLDAGAPVIPTGQINPAPFRTIPAMVYNGLPIELKGLIGGPLGNVEEDVPIGTDGHAVILNIAGAVPITPGMVTNTWVVPFGQAVPKPFCNSGSDYVYVQGPVILQQSVTIGDDLKYQCSFTAEGTLQVTPINPLDGTPIGETLSANVLEKHWGQYSDRDWTITSTKRQAMTPADAPGAGSFSNGIRITSSGNNAFSLNERCADALLAAR